MKRARWILVVVSAGGCAAPPLADRAPGEREGREAREEIIVLRSVREERNTTSTWCTAERTGFAPISGGAAFEDRFSMWTVTVRPGDGRIVDTKTNRAGDLHACFAQAAEPGAFAFYAEARINGVAFTGIGQCVLLKRDHPERGVGSARCNLDLRDLPARYVGGLLTASSMLSRTTVGETTDPPGYTQSSIATVRLWRAPQR